MVINASCTVFARIYLDQALRKLQAAGMDLLYCDTDSAIFRAKKSAEIPLPCHPTAFGHFSNEIAEDEMISLVVCNGSKNYSYEKKSKITQELSGRVTKIRGLSLSGQVQEAMDTQRMLTFVEKMQEDKKVKQLVPQRRLIINGVSKTISAEEVQKMYSNFSNEKRYYNAQAHPTRLWAYGTTSYNY
jgi:hypothetical protein